MMMVVLGALALVVVVTGLASARRQLVLARAEMREARQALERRDDSGALAALDRADTHLDGAGRVAARLPMNLLAAVPLAGSPVKAVRHASQAGRIAVDAGRVVARTGAALPTSSVAALDGKDLSEFHHAARNSVLALDEAATLLASAYERLAGPAGAFLPQLSGPARAMRSEIARSRSQLEGAGRGLTLLEELTAADSDVRLLVLSQDTLELRPTGGYIGSYGLLDFSGGAVRLEKFEATEDLPPASPPLAAPVGLADFLPGEWGLSNVNWWPDFPTTASAAAEMFRRQGGGDVDGVLALTELVTARLVGVLGPLKLPSYAEPVIEAGFDRRVLQEVELKRPLDTPRKKFLVEMSDVLFDSLLHLPAGKVPPVADVIRRSVGQGDIQLWFADESRQAGVADAEVAGALPVVEGDFLMVVDANMGAGKANLDVSKRVEYRVERDGDGALVGRVRIEVVNDGVETPINPFYLGYLRVYVPEHARLIPSGPSQVQQPAADGRYLIFSQPVVVMPKQSEVITFEYLLPEAVVDGDRYRLNWRRQVGTRRDELRVVVGSATQVQDPASRSMNFAHRLEG